LDRNNGFLQTSKGKNARRFRDWPGTEKALGANFVVEEQYTRVIDQARFARLFRPGMSGSEFDELIELFEGADQQPFW
jgi:hypothetical protein